MGTDSSRGSCVSLTESEPCPLSKYSSSQYARTVNTRDSGNNFHTHKYNTRLSARRFSTFSNVAVKELYVDLSSSCLETPRNNFEIVTKTWRSPKERRESSSSIDSREFDFGHKITPKKLEFRVPDMFEPNPCVVGQPRNNWLKYFMVLSLWAILYVYLQLLHNTDVIKGIRNDLRKLRYNFEESKHTLNRVEGLAHQLKHDHMTLEKNLHNVIAKELEIYSSDKTGKTDFALESTGGRIIKLSPGTENFEQAVSVFGVKLCDGKHGPRAMIQTDMSPGHCWAIKGSSGGVIIKLLGPVKIDAVSLEHISKDISPTGEISSAPKNFSVWGLNTPTGYGIPLGEFTYDVKGSLVQTFAVKQSDYFEFVEFQVLTNQGNPEFTCTYRFRVHGSLENGGGS